MKREDIVKALCEAVRGSNEWTKGWTAPGEGFPGESYPTEQIDKTLAAYFAGEGIEYEETLGDMSGYAPAEDAIVLPTKEQFKTSEYYHATKAHEAIHSTGAYVRCDREIENPFGSYRYAKEELTAEIGALFLLNEYGMDIKKPLENTKAYIQNWAKHLQSNPRWIQEAADRAAEAVDYIEEYK